MIRTTHLRLRMSLDWFIQHSKPLRYLLLDWIGNGMFALRLLEIVKIIYDYVVHVVLCHIYKVWRCYSFVPNHGLNYKIVILLERMQSLLSFIFFFSLQFFNFVASFTSKIDFFFNYRNCNAEMRSDHLCKSIIHQFWLFILVGWWANELVSHFRFPFPPRLYSSSKTPVSYSFCQTVNCLENKEEENMCFYDHLNFPKGYVDFLFLEFFSKRVQNK